MNRLSRSLSLLTLSLWLLCAGCSKKEDPTPANIAGIYDGVFTATYDLSGRVNVETRSGVLLIVATNDPAVFTVKESLTAYEQNYSVVVTGSTFTLNPIPDKFTDVTGTTYSGTQQGTGETVGSAISISKKMSIVSNGSVYTKTVKVAGNKRQ